MINVNDLFFNQLLEEVGYAFQYGVSLKTPTTIVMPSIELHTNKLVVPSSITELYHQTSKLEILWEIHNSEENIKPFLEDKFLVENYFNNNYDWGVIQECLSGYINITNAEAIFNPKFCKQQAYYYTLTQLNEDADSFFPFDINWGLTACLKKEDHIIKDNIWLVHSDDNVLFNMELSVESYLNLAYNVKGFHYWQLVYLMKEKTFYHELMLRFLPKIFSHITLDLTEFSSK